jgi:hypothetical protein
VVLNPQQHPVEGIPVVGIAESRRVLARTEQQPLEMVQRAKDLRVDVLERIWPEPDDLQLWIVDEQIWLDDLDLVVVQVNVLQLRKLPQVVLGDFAQIAADHVQPDDVGKDVGDAGGQQVQVRDAAELDGRDVVVVVVSRVVIARRCRDGLSGAIEEIPAGDDATVDAFGVVQRRNGT